MRLLLRLALLALPLSLTGCLPNFFGSGEETAPELPVPANLSPVPAFIAMNSTGTQASIEDENFGGLADVSVEGEFYSASGRICKRAVVSKPPHESEIVVLCRQGNDWEMMPRVWGRGLQ